MPDTWICSQCRSVNEGKGRCYKCRAPRAATEIQPADLPTIGRSATVAPTGRYRSSAFRALIASALILALATAELIGVVLATLLIHQLLDGNRNVIGASAPLIQQLAWIRLGLVIASLVTFAAWISRVVDNIPPLTGSYPQATPRGTIWEVLIPFVNFFRIPAILREALRLLDPGRNGDVLVGIAAFPLILGLVGDWPGGIVAGIVIGLVATDLRSVIDLTLAYSQVLTAFVLIGSVFLIAVIARVESASRRRAAEVRIANG